MVQLYWNYREYQINKQNLISKVQLSLDNSVEAYFANITKSGIITYTSTESGESKEVSDTIVVKTNSRWGLRKKVDSTLQNIAKLENKKPLLVKRPNNDSYPFFTSNRAIPKNIDSLISKVFISISRDTLDLKKLNSYIIGEFERNSVNVVKQYGIKTATSVYLDKGNTINVPEIIEKVGLPCFVKPNNAGSSFGISKAKTKEDILPAIEKAFKEDSQILIESFLDGPEITIGVFLYKGVIEVLPMTEIVTENDFFDYEAKYLGKSEEITPARISDEIHQKLEKIAIQVYQILNMSGFSRSEYILVNNEPHFLEMNTVPGLTSASIIPQQAAAAGISLPELFHNAIEMALNK